MIRNYTNPAAEKNYRAMMSSPESFPISFNYDGKNYSGLSPEYFTLVSENVTVKARTGAETTERIYKFCDTLTLRLITGFYKAHGVSEWTLWFENNGSENSGIKHACV